MPHAQENPFDSQTSMYGVYPPPTPEQLEKIEELRHRMGVMVNPKSYGVELASRPLLFAAKWLQARKWNVDKAAAMYESAAMWRLHHRIDERPWFPAMRPPRGYDAKELEELQGLGPRPKGQLDLMEDAVSDISPSRWHFWDKGGRPVMIERSGLVQVDKLEERCRQLARPGEHFTSNYSDYDIAVNEMGSVLVAHRNKYASDGDARNHVTQATVIMDLKGMGVRHFTGAAFQLMQASTEMQQRYYPEGLYCCYCVNAPSIAKVGWTLFQPFLDKNLQQKVKFCKPGEETTRTLIDAIGAERVPKFLGGECECEGGCVPLSGVDAGAPDRWSGVSHRNLTHHLHVKAGQETWADFLVTEAPKTELRWALHADTHDVDFDVTLHSADGKRSEVISVGQRLAHGEGNFAVPESLQCSEAAPCALRISLDNRFSWALGKDIRWRVEPREVYDAAVAERDRFRDVRFADPLAANPMVGSPSKN